MPSVGNLYVRLKADIRDYEKKMDKTFKSMGKMGSKMKSVGRGMTLGLTLPLVGASAAAINLSTDLNKGMAEVATLIPGNAERIDELKKNVQDLSISTGKATTDLTGGLYQVISAFGDSSNAAKQLEITTKAAVAGVATTTESLNLLSAITKGYGDTSSEAMQKAADLSFQVVKLGQTTFPELAASMGRTIPLAAAMKVKQEELAAVYATLTGVTGNAAEVSTQAAAILRATMKPTEDMAKAIEKLGYSSAETMLQERGMVGSLQELIGTTDGSKEAIAGLFGRAEALTAVFALTGAQSEDFASKLAAMQNAAGSMTEAFDEQTKGVNATAFQWAQMKRQLIVTAQNVGDALLPALASLLEIIKPLIEKLGEWARKFADADEKTQKTIAIIAAVVAAIGPLVSIIGTVVTALAGLKVAIAAIGAIGMGPLGLLLAAVTAAVIIWKNWDKIEPIVKQVYEAVKTWMVDKFNAVVDSIKGAIDSVTGFFGDMYHAVVGGSYVPDMIREIGDWFGKLHTVMRQPMENAVRAIEDLCLDLATTGSANFRQFAESVLADLARMIIRLKLTTPLMQAIGSLGSSSATAAASAGGIGFGGAPPDITSGMRGSVGGHGSGLGGLVVEINDYRGSGEPVSAQLVSGAGGRKILRVMVEDAVNAGYAGAAFDRTMQRRYGLRVRGVGR